MTVKGTLLIVVLLAAGCAGFVGLDEDDTPKSVKALKYETWVNQYLDFVHNNPKWIPELYFPEQGIVCNVIPELDWDMTGFEPGESVTILKEGQEAEGPGKVLRVFTRYNLAAFYSGIRNVSHMDEYSTSESDPMEVEVPFELAQRIFKIAELNKSIDDLTKLQDMSGLSKSFIKSP